MEKPMGLLDRLLGRKAVPYNTYDPAQRVLPDPYEPYMGIPGQVHVADPGVPLNTTHKGQVEQIWRTQPNVRKVVDFIARSIASIPYHTYERVSDTDRSRVTEHPLADLMSAPRPRLTPYRFWHSVLSDSLLYDRWAATLLPNGSGGWQLEQIPSWRLHFEVDGLRRVEKAWYWNGEDGLRSRGAKWAELDLDTLIYDHGYAPNGPGLSPMVTLQDILDESSEAVTWRRQQWKNGARVQAYMTRPQDAPPWSDPARRRFRDNFRAAYRADGPNAGGVPLLEDGMELKQIDAFSPADALDLEGRKLSAIEVASAFHIAPELVGAREGNYSNLREFRQMLYRDSLGPYYSAIEQVLNVQLVPVLESTRPIYIEANVESKLRGSFEEQAQILSTSTGAPWMTRAEARGRMNLPYAEGTDELVVPLNVLTGGQASPRDTGDQNRTFSSGAPGRKAGGPRLYKAAVPDPYVTRIQKTLSDFFTRQGRSVQSRIGAGQDWWDKARWDKELTEDVHRLAVLVSTYVGESTVEGLGFEPSAYSSEATINYLRAVAERIAEQTNETTYDQVVAARASEPDEGEDPVAHVFDVAADSRSEQASMTVGTTFAGFAAAEAARQAIGGQATKTWIVNSANPRASHAGMDGETVPIDDLFSNGLEYPGSIGGGPEETAGCECSLQINVP